MFKRSEKSSSGPRPGYSITRRIESISIYFNTNLDLHGFLLFQRLFRFYKTLNILSALVAGAAVGVLQFQDFHPATTSLMMASAGLNITAVSASIISIMLAVMLMFRYEDQESATRWDITLLWFPLVLLDFSILAFLIGLLLWYAEGASTWRCVLMFAIVGSLLLFSIYISLHMYKHMKRPGGLGRDERLGLEALERGEKYDSSSFRTRSVDKIERTDTDKTLTLEDDMV